MILGEDKSWERTEEYKKVFGVTDTARRGVCYLKRFLDDDSRYCDYTDHQLTTVENREGVVSAEASRRYTTDYETVRETLTMQRMKLNGMQSPFDEIADVYC